MSIPNHCECIECEELRHKVKVLTEALEVIAELKFAPDHDCVGRKDINYIAKRALNDAGYRLGDEK